ncbi:hypothetical protein JTB14_024944, partial [Gonioctena quinquepunctata]
RNKKTSSTANELGLANVGGVFVVLMGGWGVRDCRLRIRVEVEEGSRRGTVFLVFRNGLRVSKNIMLSKLSQTSQEEVL